MLVTIAVSALLIALDQLFKYLAAQYLAPMGSVVIIPGVLGLNYFENTGAAFSLLRDRQILLIAVTGVALLVALYVLLFRRPKARIDYIAILLLFSGGMGNLIDRVLNRYVVDYIEFLFINFAVFNFADMLVVFGFILLTYSVFTSEYKLSKAKKAQAADKASGEIAALTPQDAKDEDESPVKEADVAEEAAHHASAATPQPAVPPIQEPTVLSDEKH